MSAHGVFGIPIDENYMRQLPRSYGRAHGTSLALTSPALEYSTSPAYGYSTSPAYGYSFTTKDMAAVAREVQYEDGKVGECRAFLENCKQANKYGKNVSCMVYNATGGDLTYVLSHDWHGHLLGERYPHTIRNGQWGAWFHLARDKSHVGSTAAVVYRGKNFQGKPKDWLQSWGIPAHCNCNHHNLVHVEARDAEHYSNVNWNCIRCLLTPDKSKDECDGCTSEATIGRDNVALYEGTMGVTP